MTATAATSSRNNEGHGRAEVATPSSATAVPDADINALRHFNRFYTRRVGVLGPYLGGDLTLTDVRVLYELAHAPSDALVASEIARTLGHDTGYLSRILKRFEGRGWVARTPNPKDGRQAFLSLTPAGRAAFAPLNARSHAEVTALLEPLSPADRAQLIGAISTVERLLARPDEAAAQPSTPLTAPGVVIRDTQAGDLGWIVQQHAEVYWNEYRWDVTFEALVAEIVASFARNHNPDKERVFVAELDGERVGAVFLIQGSAPTTAKLRLLCLSPNARGLRLGSRLVDECIAYSREKGYTKIELWTHSCLLAARRIYASRGFKLVASDPYVGFGGHDLVGESWVLDLE